VVEEPVVEEPEPVKDAADEQHPAVVASLHLGDLSGPEIDSGATLEFDVVEFGFGEREDDIDIEEID
jgi:hypothetical protein